MEYYELRLLKQGLEALEQYLIEFATAEKTLLAFGLKMALELPGYEEAQGVLVEFSKNYASFRRFVALHDRELGKQIDSFEEQACLSEKISLISLKLRMTATAVRQKINLPQAFVNKLALSFFPRMLRSKEIFREEDISLQKTIVRVGELRGYVEIAEELFSWRQYSDDEIFKPSNVSTDRVLELIDGAIGQVESANFIPPTHKENIIRYLREAKEEAISKQPSWSKIVGALVVVAALLSGTADAPGAVSTVRSVIEYILGTSVEQPLKHYLAPQDTQEDHSPDNGLEEEDETKFA
jgi:hypothetical protein